MKQKIIELLFKYIPILAKKLWPGFRDSLIGNKTPKIIDFRNEPDNNNVILFLHGFSGESATTFGNIPQYIKEEERMKGWDMFSIGYSSNQMPSLGIGIWAAIPDITKLADFLNTTIRNQFAKYKQIAIVAHSMGGLMLQKAILELNAAECSRINFVLLFGTPSNGLNKAAFVKFWNRQLRDMASDGPFVTKLRKKWNETFAAGYPFSFKVVAGTDDEFVPTASSQQPFDKKYCEVVSGNHLAIVKPDDKNHAGYQLIIATLTKTAFNNPFTDKEAINLLQGNYTEVISKLLPQKDQLNKQGLAKLIFALEGLGRGSEAIKILEDSSLAANNSDLLGIIGGRYKRKYLGNYETADAEKSFGYYKKALEIATQKNDQEQIYYHAINLAFLSLVCNDDKAAMKMFAQTALGAANSSPDEYWKYATVAEASMYLGDMDTAKMEYIKAAVKPGVREKLSIYANAFMGYTTLNKSDKEDDFIKLLKEQLLA
jgi:pimeloyl-ACP methyl ester carboxylesterase